jgi:hypothetical protein
MEQRFVPIAVQTLGYRFTWRFDPRAAQGGKLLWISLSGNNGPHDAQARFSGSAFYGANIRTFQSFVVLHPWTFQASFEVDLTVHHLFLRRIPGHHRLGCRIIV